MRTTKAMLTILLALCVQLGFAQSSAVKGTVKGPGGEPIPGASVIEKGTKNGTASNAAGAFSISVSGSDAVLVISSIGFETQERKVDGNSTIDVYMKESQQQLDEVVVTGQGVGISRKRISTTVSSISAKEIKNSPAMQLDQLIQSKLPNAQIKLSSGQPGTASIIRSRGPVSANTNTTPVIMIDGIRVDNLNSNAALGIGTGGAQSSAVADIPMEDIDRIEFIPGGAATTLYGADAANGVLQIFTKRGKSGKSSVFFESQVGQMVGTTDYLRFENSGKINFEPGMVQNYRLGFSGGNDAFSYSFSGSLYEDDGFNSVNEQVRRNFRTTLSARVSNRLRYSASLAYSNSEFTRDYNANTSYARFGNLEGGSFGDLDDYTDSQVDSLSHLLKRQGDLTNITERINRFNVANNFTYDVNDKVIISFDFGLDSRNSKQQELGTNAVQISKGSYAEGTTDQGYINVSGRNFLVMSANLNANYEENWGDFNFLTTVGGQVFRSNDYQTAISATGVPDGSQSINNSADQSVQDFYNTVTSFGIYLAENVGWKDKLFLDLGLRFDGNTAFGEEIGLIPLLKVGASYVISDEKFFKDNISKDYINILKFRGNYGEATLFPTPFANDRTFAANPYIGQQSFAFDNPGNDNIQSEIAKTTELGLDIGLFKRLTLSLTYYNTRTEGALFTPPQAPSTGLAAQEDNVGEILNKGYEIALSASIISNEKHRLNGRVSYNYNENEVVSTGGAPEFAVGGFSFLGSFVKANQPLGYLRGAQVVSDGNGGYEVERNAYLGTTFSPTFGTFGLDYTWNNKLTLFLNGDYQFGGQGVNVDDVLRYFGGVNDEDRFPQEVIDGGITSFFDLAGYWVEDANYVKVRTIGAEYNFGSFMDSRVKNLRIGFTVQNAFNWVSSSFDPDVTGSGIQSQGGFAGGGFGFGTESAPRIFLGSLRVNL
jgi:outer membrane receptor protein involved in Fe transport